MKKKLLRTFISLLNCMCLIFICTALTACGGDETLSEADSQLFQITCKAMAESAASSGIVGNSKYASMVCDYDEEKYGTKVLATEIRSNGYNTPYSDSNYLSYTITFVTTLSANSNTRVSASAVVTFNLANASATKKIANYIFCSTDSRSRKENFKNSCESDGYQYSKRALNAEGLSNLVKNGYLDGHSINLTSSEKIPNFEIYESKTSVNDRKNGLRDLHILSQIYEDSYHQSATTLSSKQKEICSVALSKLVSTISGIDYNGDTKSGFRKSAMDYILTKMTGAQERIENDPFTLSGELDSSFFTGDANYTYDSETGSAIAGCKASITLTINYTYSYYATYTFTASKNVEGSIETWNVTDENGTNYAMDDLVY